jgi:S1-C subfamily serine protease
VTRGGPGIRVFRAVSPAVVVVVVGSVKNNNFDPEGMGTGAVVDARGYVLTNWHVIKGCPGALVFLKPSGNSDLANAQAFGARVIYQDPNVDLALLKMINPPSTLPWLAVGEIAQVQVAEDIHIVGHPHGNLWSYSTGVISQIRDGFAWTYGDGSRHLAKVLQLQTAINPGNSGGPVVDDSGSILGLVAMSEEGQNLNYAIAADVIKRFLFTGTQMTTRGVEVSTSSVQPQQLLAGKLDSRVSLSKAVYADAVLYSVGEVGKSHSGVVANFSDGTVIRAWDLSPNGSFNSWSATLPNGRTLVGVASNGMLALVSTRQGLAGSLSR